MSWLAKARQYRPRRADGLPSHQREVEAFPRFSDQPLRWAPAPKDVSLSIVVDGSSVAELSAEDLAGIPRIERIHDFHCVTTWSHRGVRWGGWPMGKLLVAADIDLAALPRFAKVVGGDGRHAVLLTEDLLQPSVLVVDRMNGAPLGQRHGGPIRLVSPEQYGYKSAKHLECIEFAAARPEGSFGKKEHLRARVALEERHGSLPSWLVRWPYRLTVVPTALAGDRGLERSPQQ